MNCSCGKEISSPKLTGDYCTQCYFKRKNAVVEIPTVTAQIHETESESPNQSAATEGRKDIAPEESVIASVEEFLTEINDNAINSDSDVSGVVNDNGMERIEVAEDIGNARQINKESDRENGEEGRTTDVAGNEGEGIGISDRTAKADDREHANGLGSKGIRYCQSCIERGYGKEIATREWTPGYFICDKCFEPLLQNIVGFNQTEVEKIKHRVKSHNIDTTVILDTIWEFLDIPSQLRVKRTDDFLKTRNEIFNHQALSLVNMTIEDVAEKIEHLTVALFYIKETNQNFESYISSVKQIEREKNQLNGIDISIKEKTKVVKSSSKIKQSQDQKMADMLLKSISNDPLTRLKMYTETQKKARETEFKKVTGS